MSHLEDIMIHSNLAGYPLIKVISDTDRVYSGDPGCLYYMDTKNLTETTPICISFNLHYVYRLVMVALSRAIETTDDSYLIRISAADLSYYPDLMEYFTPRTLDDFCDRQLITVQLQY